MEQTIKDIYQCLQNFMGSNVNALAEFNLEKWAQPLGTDLEHAKGILSSGSAIALGFEPLALRFRGLNL